MTDEERKWLWKNMDKLTEEEYKIFASTVTILLWQNKSCTSYVLR